MKLPDKRIWCGDFETVVESERPYFAFLKILSALADDLVLIDGITEDWFYESDNDINIRITYTCQNQTHVVWTKRRGDFLNMEVLFLLNKQLELSDYRFESSHGEESVYFIDASEKTMLAEQGVVFEETSPLLQFDFMFYNILMSLETGENDFTYKMLAEMALHIEAYHEANWQKKDFKLFQDTLKSKVLAKVNWDKITEYRIDADKLYAFANKSV